MKYLDTIKKITKYHSLFEPIIQRLEGESTLSISKLPLSLKTYLTIELFKKDFTPFLICENYIQARQIKSELELLGLVEQSILFTFEQEDIHSLSTEEFLTQIQKDKFIIVTTPKTLDIKVQSKDVFERNQILISKDTKLSYNELIQLLEELNYSRQKFVESKGEFAVRGSIIDIFSYSHTTPVRIEFDGDEISSLRLFDPESQRSFQIINEYPIYSTNLSEFFEKDSSLFDYASNPILITREIFLLNRADELRTYKLIVEKEFHSKDLIDFKIRSIPSIHKNLEILEYELKKLVKENYRIVITSDQESQLQRMKDLLLEYSEFFLERIDDGTIKFELIPVLDGFILEENKVAIFPEHQIFERPFFISSRSVKKPKTSSTQFLKTIQIGDYVVHSDYGIGKFLGLEQIKFNDTTHEAIKIAFADNDIVYVNINYLHKVKKYSSKEGAVPKLSKPGTAEWKNTKEKIKEKIKDAVQELIRLYAERKASKGFKFSTDTVWQKELEASFYYEDTLDQIKVTEEIKRDMESDFPMDRLICGDVGFGKTEVAIRAAFKAVMDSKQVAVLVPTTILAEQHYNTFKDRLEKYPVEIAMLSRFIKKSEQTKIVEKLKKGEIDIIIGTHRLLSSDIQFKDLGLLIIDEEHRFGVLAKEKIRKIKSNVDTLYLTATPIPRTLNMALSGLRDISLITTPPPNRLPIITEVMRFDINRIREIIRFEISRGGQVFFVHDRVKSIQKIADYLQSHIPEAKFIVAHGQMKPSKLEEVLHQFLSRKYDVLISTKIIESGIDIPNANTIIINRADRFGLAELYQLRGRVGRTNKQAYAYLVVPSLKTITKDAIQRIQALEEFSELGSGFSLSMRDLEIRGSGNLLGTEQSGFINAVGFDMYMKILEEAVSEIKQQEYPDIIKPTLEKESIETTLEVFFNYTIPDDYIYDQEIRLNYYSRIFSSNNSLQLDEIAYEMRDQFGEFPDSVINLFEVAKIRLLAQSAFFEKVIIQKHRIALSFPRKEKTQYYDLYFNEIINFIVKNYGDKSQLKEIKDNLLIEFKIEVISAFQAMQFLRKFLNEIILIIEREKNKDAKELIRNFGVN
ncbi:MAG: transcription-repair coupling factor [Ignavibacteria bacterium]|nr:transcription-repair coupling factor [Ignavibacteria bacterium]MDH7528532.1 transcription-repair coupling factor [Ignavibacteria bacterium]